MWGRVRNTSGMILVVAIIGWCFMVTNVRGGVRNTSGMSLVVAIIRCCGMVTNVREGKKYQWDESRGSYYPLVWHGYQCEGG